MTETPQQRKGRLQQLMRGVDVAATYQKSWFGKDIVAGNVLSTPIVPQGMARADLAGLPPITGPYTTILFLAYAVFGPSRILVLGPDSSLGPMIAATVLPLVASDGDPQKAVVLASMLALMVGAIMIPASVAKLGAARIAAGGCSVRFHFERNRLECLGEFPGLAPALPAAYGASDVYKPEFGGA